MNIKSIKYGRIKRQAPDRIVITKEQISAVLERMNERKPEPIEQQPTAFDMAHKIWNARHT